MAFQIFDRWDPEDTWGFNINYGFDENTGAFKPSGGDYVKYNNSNQAAGNVIDHVFWSPSTQSVYYRDPDSGRYVKANTEGLDVSGGIGSYLSDDQLDALATSIANNISANRSQKALDEAKRASTPVTGTGISSVAIPTPSSKDSIQQKEYLKRKQDANALLQKMITEDPDNTPQEDNTVYYKYGTDEVDMKYYLHNIGSNLQKYLESQDWNQAQKNAFMNSYNTYKTALQEQLNTNSGRFSTDDAGTLLDSGSALVGTQGTLIMDENGNTYNSYDDVPKKLRDSVIEFSPDQEVSNYLNTIGQAIVEAGKTKKTSDWDGDFDVSKQGFMKYWLDKINPAGGTPDIDPYLALDPVSPEGKRERTNRTKYLANQLTRYLKKINNSKSDFSNSAFGTKEAYMQKIQQAIDNLNNGWDSTDSATLQAIGITPDFYSSFMSEEANPLMSEEELSAEMEKNKSKAASDYIEKIKGVYDNYAGQGNTFTSNNEISVFEDSRYNPSSPGVAQRLGTALENLGYSAADEDAAKMSADALWETIKAALRSGSTSIITRAGTKNLQEVLPIILPTYLSLFKDSTSTPGMKYLDDPEHDSQYGAILCLKNGKLYYDFIGNVKESTAWQQLKTDFDKNYVVKTDAPKYSFDKLGGVLRKFDEGGQMSSEVIDAETMAQLQALASMQTDQQSAETTQSSTGTFTPGDDPGRAFAQALFGPRKAAAQAKGLSLERYNQKQRAPNGQPDFYNKDNGVWKTEDYLRLGSIAADIASLVMDPISGAVTNVGSTATKFLADWADDSVTAGEMWKNLGMNLGMDALSIVPIVGDAAGTGGKLIKSVKAIAPKLMYGLTAWGVLGTLKNGANIMESFQKIMSDEKLTVGDWQNIAQAITAVAGVNGAVKSGVAKKLATNRARVDDAVGLGLRQRNADGTLGKAKDYIFRGEKASEFKKLIAEGNIEAINKKLQSLEGFSDFEINTNLKSIPISARLPVGRTTGTDGKKHWEARNPFSVERKIDSFEIFDPSKLRGGYASRNLLNTDRQNAVEAGNVLNHEFLKTKAEVDVIRDEHIKEITAAASAATEKIKGRINATTEKIEGVKDADGNIVTEGLVGKKKNAETAKATTEADLIKAQEALDNISKENKQRYRTIDGVDYYAEKTKGARLKGKTSLDDAVNNLSSELATKNQDLTSVTAEHAVKKAELDSLLAKGKLTKKERLRKVALTSELNTLENTKNTLISESNNIQAKYKALSEWQAEYKRAKDLQESLDPTFAGSLAGKKLELEGKIAEYNLGIAKLRERLERLKGNAINGTGAKGSWEKQQLMSKIGSGPYLIEYAPGRYREVKDIKQIIDDMHLLKKGGRLQFLQTGNKVKKNARHVGNTVHNGDIVWYDDYITEDTDDNPLNWTPEAREVFRGINPSNIDEINQFQNVTYRRDFPVGSSNPKSGHGSELFETEEAGVHQSEFNRLANPLNQRFKRGKRISTLPGAHTTDTEEGGWVDHLPGTMTWLRHFGSLESDVDKINNAGALGEGVEAFWNPETQMVNYRMKDTKIPVTPAKETPSGVDPGLLTAKKNPIPGTSGRFTKGNSKKNPKINKFLGLAEDLAPLGLEAARLAYLKSRNARNAQNALEAEIPYYQTGQEDNVLVHSDLKKEARGAQAKAKMLRQAEHALTSDGQANMNFKKELLTNGQAYEDTAMDQSSDTYRTTQKEDQAQRKENHSLLHNIAEQNKLAAIQTLQNKSKIMTAAEAQLTQDSDAFHQLVNTTLINKLQERTANRKARVNAELTAAVQNKPNNYGANLTAKELSLYNKAMAGTNPSSMSKQEQDILKTARTKVNQALQNQYYTNLSIEPSQYYADANSSIATKAKFTPVLSLAKNGTRLKIAKIRERSKNADRFAKSIQKQIESLDKKLDRIAKSMYGLPKPEVIKAK